MTMSVSDVLVYMDVMSCIRNDGDYDKSIVLGDCDVEYKNGDPPPTEQEFHDAAEKLATHLNDTQYLRDIEEQMPTAEAQLKMQYNDAVNNTTTWLDTVQAVYDANPPPS